MYFNRHQTLLALVALFCCFSPAKCINEKEIIRLMQSFRDRMCHPIPKLGLPPLDPLRISHQQLAMNNQFIVNFTGSIDDFVFYGLSDAIISDIKIQVIPGLRSRFELTFPLTGFKSNYTAKGSLAYILNLAGDGNAEAYIRELKVKISLKYILGLHLRITSLTIDIYLDEVYMNFEKLLEEERVNDFVHALVNEMGIELADSVWKFIKSPLETNIQKLVNSFLQNYKINDLIAIIVGGGGDSPIFEGVPADCKNSTRALNN